MARGLHAIQQKGGIWEGRLVYLAEAAGGLVELTRLDASDGDVRIKGMAGTEEQAREFGSRLESLWGGRVRMHSIRRNQTGTGITFELSQRGEEANAGTGEKKKIYRKAAAAVLLSLLLGTAGFQMGKQADAMEAQNLSFKNWSARHGPMASTAGWTGEGTMTGPEAFQEAGLLIEETSERAGLPEQAEKNPYRTYLG
jgi:hypothetical protein